MRRLAAFLFSLPLIVAGGIGAHWLAYQMAVPEASARQTLLAATGHSYTSWEPAMVGTLGAVATLLLVALILGRGPALGRVRIHPGLFVLLPMIGFAIQEHAERIAVGYGSPWHVWQEPTFWRGLLLQIPFGLAAFLIASLLLRTAKAIERVVLRRRRGVRILGTRPRRPTLVAPYTALLAPRIRCGDALRFRGPPVGLRCCL